WMVEDGVASRLDINAVRTGTDSLTLAITIYQRDGNIHNIIFDDIWSELNG
ncbi:phage GP46 family protein, partial [Escherichia coli]|nr:phage GP46 family protein [Escherichia coli]